MARKKSSGKTAALAGLAGLAGLGALGLFNKVDLTDPNRGLEANDFPSLSQAEFDQMAKENVRSAVGEPVISEEEIIKEYKGIPGVRSGTGLPIRAGDDLLRSIGEGRKKGGVVSASKRADGMAQRGKTRGKMV
jgi:hypothetical protein